MAMVLKKRIEQVGEIAAVVIWLCSDEVSFVTASTFPVEGGMFDS
ncbi:MAG: SDR family oxidoreductase [Chloroflexi bacterium]|jgi:NAD(P)-dependent dehydrogenase (short-subunit alcohol dehydrogenase family)|nr:SDR family oxidoreductase [Chloroflexota bacterium]